MESKAPDHVNLVYRKVGKTHVIASKGIVGLVHVAHHDLAAAVRNAMTALSTHISRVYGPKFGMFWMQMIISIWTDRMWISA